MAEFTEVIKQAKRMCKAQNHCYRCPINVICNVNDCNKRTSCVAAICDVERLERIVMDWAAAHPEPRYPSWNEAWGKLFPSVVSPPCKTFFGLSCDYIGREYVGKSCYVEGCRECLEQPIPADIAEKLGIKPIGGTEWDA